MATLPNTIKPARTGGGWWSTILWGASIAAAFLFVIGPAISHLIDRVRTRHEANSELKARANWYRNQIAQQLGMDPSRVTKDDLLLAAKLNPQLAKVVSEVYRQEGDNNRSSMMVTAGASAASLIPGGGAVVKIAAGVGGAVGGGALANLMKSDRIDPQMVAEAINEHIASVRESGADARQAAKPELVFMLRVAQNDQLAAGINEQFGKQFHHMTEAEQRVVMNAYPELSASAESEAYAVASDMLPVQELVAREPSPASFASRIRRQNAANSFVQREDQRRAMAQHAANIAPV